MKIFPCTEWPNSVKFHTENPKRSFISHISLSKLTSLFVNGADKPGTIARIKITEGAVKGWLRAHKT